MSEPIIRREVTKPILKDKEVYLRVPAYDRYRVVIRDKQTGTIIKEDVRTPILKEVRRDKKTYKYYYVRVLVPWYSTLRNLLGKRGRYELVVELYQ